MLQWLSQNCAFVQISHNAHHEHRTTVSRYLLHRERLGDTLIFTGRDGRQGCVDADTVWELHIRCMNGRTIDLVGAGLTSCLARDRKSVV
jgi:hypothetical protein